MGVWVNYDHEGKVYILDKVRMISNKVMLNDLKTGEHKVIDDFTKIADDVYIWPSDGRMCLFDYNKMVVTTYEY